MKNAIPMTRRRIENYGNIRSEIIMLEEQIASEDACEITDTVLASSNEPPYSKHVVAIKGYVKKAGPRLRARAKRYEDECTEVERFIEGVDDSIMRQILTRRYIELHTVEATAKIIGYSKSQIDRKIKTFFGNMRQDAPK